MSATQASADRITTGPEIRLAQSRLALEQLLGTRRGAAQDGASHAGFPRSHTMRALFFGRGWSALAAVACGLLISRPAMGLRLLRLLPLGTISRMFIARYLHSRRTL